MTFYVTTAQTVLRLLTKFGAATTLTRASSSSTVGDYDTDTAIATPTETVDNVKAAVFPVGDDLVDGSSVLATDQVAYVSAVDIDPPEPGNVLAWGGRSLTVVKAKNYGPAGVFVLYELQVRA